MYPYLVHAPPYMNASGGIRVMHKLIHELRERGYDAYCLTSANPRWNERIETDLTKIDPETIVVYPEGVTFNPTGLRKRVRWILYFSELNKDCPEEKVFTYDKKYLDVPNLLRVSTLEKDLFTKGTNDELDCFWVHKGWGKPRDPITDGMFEITDSNPDTREGLADLLKRTKNFYTYDKHSQLNYEAYLCGCNVIYLGEDEQFDGEATHKHYQELETLYAKELDNFIEITQNME